MSITQIDERTPLIDWFEYPAGAAGNAQDLIAQNEYPSLRVDTIAAYWTDTVNPLQFDIIILNPASSPLGAGLFRMTVPAGAGVSTPCPDLVPAELRARFNGIILPPGYGLRATTVDAIGSGKTCTLIALGGTL